MSNTIAYIGDHADRMIADLPSQYRTPRMLALVQALGAASQMLEDQVFILLNDTTLAASSGAQLAQWGQVVGEAIGDLAEDEYRHAIAARAIALRTSGTLGDLEAVLVALLDTSECRRFVAPPYLDSIASILQAHVRVLPSAEFKRRCGVIIDDTRAVGVWVRATVAGPGYFGFADDPDATGFDTGIFAEVLT